MKDAGTSHNAGTRVLLLGADGFIGRHIATHLRAEGAAPLCSARNTRALQQAGFATFPADLAAPESATAAFWKPVLQQVDAVVIAAGLLNGPEEVLYAVHAAVPQAICQAAKSLGGRRIVLITAVGLEADTGFARTKRAGEAVVRESGLPYVILRPSLVLGETSYGGSSLLRALAALPVVMPTVGGGMQVFDPIHAADLARTVTLALDAPALEGQTLEPCGPQRVTQREMLQGYRGWLGLKPARHMSLPLWLARGLGTLGDMLKLGPVSRTAVAQLETGVSADFAAFHKATGQEVRSFDSILKARPAGTQDLWHARLYLLRPVLRFALLFMWLLSGITGLTVAPESFLPATADLPLPDAVPAFVTRAAGVLDIGIATGLLLGRNLRRLAGLQLAIVGGYTLLAGILFPVLWLDPYGGLLKNIPVLLLILLHRILETER